jgi:hypothetical protein
MTMLTDVPVKARPCPRCGGTEHRAVPAYDEDDETLDVVSVFCARCEHHCEDTTPDEAIHRWGLRASR